MTWQDGRSETLPCMAGPAHASTGVAMLALSSHILYYQFLSDLPNIAIADKLI